MKNRLRTYVIAASFMATMCSAHAAEPPRVPKTWQEQGLMQGFPSSEDGRVTLENWLTPPFNRWAYQHARELIPSKAFVRRPGNVEPLPRDPNASLAAIKVKDPGGIELVLDDFLKQTYTDGFLVLHQGRVVYERYFNGMTAATPHQLFSVTKSFTGTLVGILEERGQIDYTKTVADYLPELKSSGYGDATIRQMMDMQVGVGWEETPEAVADPNSVFNQYAKSCGFKPNDKVSSAYAFLPTMGKINDHGEKFQYVAPVTDALGWLLERVSGKSYTQLLDDEIMSKLALEGDGFMLLDGWGKALSTGGLNLTARDLARFGLMIGQGGRYRGQRIVSEAFIKDCRFHGDKAAYARGSKDSSWMPGGAYRNQWWISDGDRPALICAGIYGQLLYVAPDKQTVIVRVASTPGSNSDSDALMPVLFREIARHLNERSSRGH